MRESYVPTHVEDDEVLSDMHYTRSGSVDSAGEVRWLRNGFAAVAVSGPDSAIRIDKSARASAL